MGRTAGEGAGGNDSGESRLQPRQDGFCPVLCVNAFSSRSYPVGFDILECAGEQTQRLSLSFMSRGSILSIAIYELNLRQRSIPRQTNHFSFEKMKNLQHATN